MTAQLTKERVGRITASRLPKILGLSPHGNRDDVLREMTREYFGDEQEFVGNFITEYGEEHEPDAIAEYEMARGVTVTGTGLDQRTIVHPSIDYLAATIDGFVGNDGLVEAKAPWRAVYTHYDQRKDIETQMRLQLECAEREWDDLAIWRPEGLLPPSRVAHDPKWWASVQGQCEDFMADFLAIVEDEAKAAPYRRPLVDVRIDAEWSAWSTYYLECLAMIECGQGWLDEAKAELIRLAGDQRSTRGSGILLTKSLPSGRTDYKKAVEALAPGADLTTFKSEPRGEATWTVRKSK